MRRYPSLTLENTTSGARSTNCEFFYDNTLLSIEISLQFVFELSNETKQELSRRKSLQIWSFNTLLYVTFIQINRAVQVVRKIFNVLRWIQLCLDYWAWSWFNTYERVQRYSFFLLILNQKRFKLPDVLIRINGHWSPSSIYH